MMISTTLRRASCFKRVRAGTRVIGAGFTLVELLVVIGIIAVLIAILMPTLGRARESANSLKCQAQERQILQALVLHANEHKGYLPLTGLPSPGLDPASLEDPNAEKYDYYGTSLETNHLMAIQGALAPQLGQQINSESKASVEAGIQQGVVRDIFVCPSDREGGRIGATVWEGGDAYSSYAFNDGVMGWATSTVQDGSGLASKPYPHSRLRGKISRFVHPAELFLFTDGNPRSDGNWQLYCDGDANLSLRDFFVTTNGPPNNPNASLTAPAGLCACWDVIDTIRHRGRMNVAFADGHVENVIIAEGDLAKISMNKGFPAF
jgi:prepilin-type processing-associated H-X9-DG protein/prepilin-type N-terminal cleavage/methylation domain-containing protein